MELRQIFSLVWKWAWLIALSVSIAAGTSYMASKAATPLYRTKTTLMIGRVTQNPDPSTIDIYASQQLAYTYIQLAQREPVLRGAIESLGLNMDWLALAGQVSASNVPQTQLLEIHVIDSDPYRAKVLADAVAEQLILLSPGSSGLRQSEQAAFTKAQMEDLQKKIRDSQDEVLRLKQELDAANSARQIQELQTQINLLENKISGWQNTYSQLLLSYEGGDVNVLSVLEEAQVPQAPFSPNVRSNVLIASAIGLILAVAGAVLIEYLDDTIKSPADVSRVVNLPSLAAIPVIDGEDYPSKLVAITDPLSPVVESYRILRTNLQFSAIDRSVRTLMLTSPSPSEGKSVSLSNLAVVLAQSGKRVILVDTDLRRPTLHKIFNLSNRVGLTDALIEVISPQVEARRSRGEDKPWQTNRDLEARPTRGNQMNPIGELFSDLKRGKAELETGDSAERLPVPGLPPTYFDSKYPEVLDLSRYLQPTLAENLYLLSSGSLPPNPTELLGSELMGVLIQILRSQADLVLFDSPPALVFADAAVLSTRVDGVLFVYEISRTRTNEALRAAEELRRVHANILGAVLNRAGKRQGGYYYHYYNYYSQDSQTRNHNHRNHNKRFSFNLPGMSKNHRTRKTEVQPVSEEN